MSDTKYLKDTKFNEGGKTKTDEFGFKTYVYDQGRKEVHYDKKTIGKIFAYILAGILVILLFIMYTAAGYLSWISIPRAKLSYRITKTYLAIIFAPLYLFYYFCKTYIFHYKIS